MIVPLPTIGDHPAARCIETCVDDAATVFEEVLAVECGSEKRGVATALLANRAEAARTSDGFMVLSFAEVFDGMLPPWRLAKSRSRERNSQV